MADLPLAQDKQLVQRLQEVFKVLCRHDLQELQALLLKEDRPDLNYLVHLPDFGDKKVYSPLLFACGLNSPELVGALVNAGAKVNITVRGYSPLSHAITDGNIALVEKLLQCGACPVDKDTWGGKSDLSRAMELKHDTPADRRTRQGIVALLCEAGVDVNDPRFAKPPVLHAAVRENDLAICKILLDSGADKTALDSTENGNTPLHIAVSREKPSVEMVELLCHQDTLNVFNKAGFTPLHLATDRGDLKVVHILVQEGANINVQALVTKLTPLDIARHKHRYYKQQHVKHQLKTVMDFQGVVDFLRACGQSRMEQKDKQPAHGLVRGRTAPPDEDKSQLKVKNLGLQEKLRSQEEHHKQEISQLRSQLKAREQEGEELKKRIRTLECRLTKQEEQYQDKLYPEGCPMAMSEKHRKLLILNHSTFLSDLHISIVIPALREKGVLTQDMEEDIRSCRIQNDMNRKLLDILPTRGEAAFYVFRQALREDPGSEHLAVLLDEEESNLSD